MSNNEDPGIKGKKLSKSDDNWFEDYKKEYSKVLDAQINYIKAKQESSPTAEDLLIRWEKKSEWFQSQYDR